MAKVEAVCIGSERRKPKRPVISARFVSGGIEGDAHKGISDREVSMLRSEDIGSAELEAGFPFPPGSLAENLVVSGLPWNLPVGTVIRIGPVVLSVIERGKKPNEPHSYDYKGWCLLPDVGLFMKVLTEGIVREGDRVSWEISV